MIQLILKQLDGQTLKNEKENEDFLEIALILQSTALQLYLSSKVFMTLIYSDVLFTRHVPCIVIHIISI